MEYGQVEFPITAVTRYPYAHWLRYARCFFFWFCLTAPPVMSLPAR